PASSPTWPTSAKMPAPIMTPVPSATEPVRESDFRSLVWFILWSHPRWGRGGAVLLLPGSRVVSALPRLPVVGLAQRLHELVLGHVGAALDVEPLRLLV